MKFRHRYRIDEDVMRTIARFRGWAIVPIEGLLFICNPKRSPWKVADCHIGTYAPGTMLFHTNAVPARRDPRVKAFCDCCWGSDT